ncbi:DUF2267 domain-containing protein, partial [Streptomyces caeruleatus]
TPEAAGELTRVTLRGLGAQLHAAQVADLSDELPPTLAAWLGSAPHGGPRGLAPLLERVAVAEPGSVSFAAEHVAVVCQAIAEVLRP